MQNDSSYSPVLWGAIIIPVVSGIELFVDPLTRNSFSFFVLGFFYLASVRYTLAVGLGVYAHEITLKKHRRSKSGAWLWICYFMVLILSSLLVPGVAIFGITTTLIITVSILSISIIQGSISRKSFTEKAHKNDITMRVIYDSLVLTLLIYESVFSKEEGFQGPFFAIVALLIMDFSVSDFARSTLLDMYSSLKKYFSDSWSESSNTL